MVVILSKSFHFCKYLICYWRFPFIYASFRGVVWLFRGKWFILQALVYDGLKMKKTDYHGRAVEGDLFAGEDFEYKEQKDEAVQYDFGDLFDRLSRSAFRSSFWLRPRYVEYVNAKGVDEIRRHAEDFVRRRLAPATPPNDGRQTPMRGHPVFIAQHATGCCCRGCLAKWHGIPAGRGLTAAEQRYVVDVIMEWIRRQMELAARQL